MLLWINITQIRHIELIEDGVIEVLFEDRTSETFEGEDAERILKMVKNYYMPIVN
jgi:hypothetical protein